MNPNKSGKSHLINTTDWQNDVTYCIDQYLKDSLQKYDGKKDYKHRTYILVDNIGIKDSTFAIRCPGMTIGHIKYSGSYPDSMIITEIKIYNDMLSALHIFYKPGLVSLKFNQFIGKPLILKEDYFDGEN